MEHIVLDQNWTLRKGFLDSLSMIQNDPGMRVDLPHDAMISTKVSPNAAAKYDSGYFEGVMCNYTKQILIPMDWNEECIGLQFDGIMMHATIEINGCKVAEHHYGYSPFYVDITKYVTFGGENRITINTNSGVQPSSRWYSGCGLFRGVTLCHGPKVHIATDGIFLQTSRMDEDTAFIDAEIEVVNETQDNKIVEVEVLLLDENAAATSKQLIQVNPGRRETARLKLNLAHPKLWDAEHPNLYRVIAKATEIGEYRTHLIKAEHSVSDEESTLFGIRTVTVDSIHGLRINGKTVKLKGGCLHHDNGLLGAASFYESEMRKVKKLKEVGFNAIRTTHNPPSKWLVEACDRVGMYIFDEAFDAWGMAKRPGDYSTYFAQNWEDDLTTFIKRDRVHPSVIIWSTGNEIPERGGLNNGYTLAKQLSDAIRRLDSGRPISNGICSFWSGLDDYLAEGQNQSQNAADNLDGAFWEKCTEAFCNGLDIVGYNYMEELYENDHIRYPERVMLGSENFPKEIGFRWPMVESHPYVIGDFTWTAWDYIGEAGIGKALYVDSEDPIATKNAWEIMPPTTSPYPWRTANDADFDITGRLLPQGAYRSVVWGSKKTYLYSLHPDCFGKVEKMSMWGFPGVVRNWNYTAYEGKPVQVVVFSSADEVELIINGETVAKKQVSREYPMPNSVRFDTVFYAGKVEAVSYQNGVEISRDCMETSGEASKLRLTTEKETLRCDGHDLAYINIDVLDENERLVTDAENILTVSVEGAATLAGFGTGNPVTEEIYSDNRTKSYRGHACAIVRSGIEPGEIKVTVAGEGIGSVKKTIMVYM